MPAIAIINQPYQVVGNQQSLSVASATPVPLPNGANGMLIQAIGQNVRITLDGSAPTTSHGYQIRAGDPAVVLLMQPNSPTLQAIQEAATAIFEVLGIIQAFA